MALSITASENKCLPLKYLGWRIWSVWRNTGREWDWRASWWRLPFNSHALSPFSPHVSVKVAKHMLHRLKANRQKPCYRVSGLTKRPNRFCSVPRAIQSTIPIRSTSLPIFALSTTRSCWLIAAILSLSRLHTCSGSRTKTAMWWNLLKAMIPMIFSALSNSRHPAPLLPISWWRPTR